VVEDNVFGVKGHSKSMDAFENCASRIESQLSDMGKENEKRMEQKTSALPGLPASFVLRVERPRIVRSHCAGVWNAVKSF
jgi:hypothetical protein